MEPEIETHPEVKHLDPACLKQHTSCPSQSHMIITPVFGEATWVSCHLRGK